MSEGRVIYCLRLRWLMGIESRSDHLTPRLIVQYLWDLAVHHEDVTVLRLWEMEQS